MAEKFETYAIVEIFGHQVIAGLVSEQVIGGQGFVRVDVPGVDGQEPFTKFFGSGAIYAITPTDKDTCLSAVQGLRQKPIDVWKLNLPQISAPVKLPLRGDPTDDDGDYSDDEDEESTF